MKVGDRIEVSRSVDGEHVMYGDVLKIEPHPVDELSIVTVRIYPTSAEPRNAELAIPMAIVYDMPPPKDPTALAAWLDG